MVYQRVMDDDDGSNSSDETDDKIMDRPRNDPVRIAHNMRQFFSGWFLHNGIYATARVDEEVHLRALFAPTIFRVFWYHRDTRDWAYCLTTKDNPELRDPHQLLLHNEGPDTKVILHTRAPTRNDRNRWNTYIEACREIPEEQFLAAHPGSVDLVFHSRK